MPRTTRASASTSQPASRKRPIEHISDDGDDDDDHSAEDVGTEMNPTSDAAGDSQHTQDTKLRELFEDLVKAQGKRREFRKTAVFEAYETAHSEIKDAITTLFDEHEVHSSRVYDAQVACLEALIARKANIEAEMAGKVAQLRSFYLAQSKSMQLVGEKRIGELS